MSNKSIFKITCAFLLVGIIGLPHSANAQVENRWLSVGSFHNFYSNIGSEIEEGFINEQQGGWQWPAIYRGQDAQAMKGMWLGVTDFTDERGFDYAERVVHVGPRVTGLGEFYPISMETVSKFPAPEVFVDGLQSISKSVNNDRIDENMAADRAIVSEMNTLLGITVKRTAMQFSQQYHDNYHIIEYEFTNTGNIDDDDEIELPNQTVEGFVAYFLNRMAPVKASRYTIGNATGWGVNTMNDRRGDGLRPSEPENFRASFAWHGYFPSFATANYNNIGAPIFVPNTTGGYLTADDTTGRLAAYHFVGTVTLHADASATDETDDPGQPSTMAYEHNDDPLYSNNDAFNVTKMSDEYDLMTRGRVPRHAYTVEPSGDFINSTSDPSLGEGGGQAYTYGYGPYTIAPGETVRIVIAEASAGISRELAEEVGRAFKQAAEDPGVDENNVKIPYTINGTDYEFTKNEWVFTGRDSLFQTFERAIANYESGYDIPQGPQPPSLFNVISAGNGIELNWDFEGDASDLTGFRIYRASGRVDSTYRLLYEASSEERVIIDGDVDRGPEFKLPPPIRGRDYYYYIQSVGSVNSDATGQTPTGQPLVSNRYYMQSFEPARLLRPAGESMEEIRVAPNPYRANSPDALRFGNQADDDRIAFYEVPAQCTVEIYTELGELITTISNENGSGDMYWNLKTNSRQRIVSGVYIARIINEDPNDDEFGSVATRKIVIIL
ncbi:T9SS type A sorting domain-containing protein [Gracilimonas tropica]|uniref:T9SS type A sorting domain-containing protein n=1 Tax=Gracilimonas tropica TaxID=454600 RepID=UPI000375567D|nr:T9SS type A sorting domain-containing protein [Gracilimonas tropica]